MPLAGSAQRAWVPRMLLQTVALQRCLLKRLQLHKELRQVLRCTSTRGATMPHMPPPTLRLRLHATLRKGC